MYLSVDLETEVQAMSRIIKIRELELGIGRPKICVPIMGRSETEFLTSLENADNSACDLIEIRADYYSCADDPGKVKSLLRKIRRGTEKPILFTLRRAEEGGKIQVSSEYYRELLSMVALSKLADLVDVEYSAVAGDKKFIETLKTCGTYVIISKHDFDKTPDMQAILDSYLKMEMLGADIVKAAYMPSTRRDVLNLISAAEEFSGDGSHCNIIAISMGRLGVVSRVMGEFLGSVVTFASLGESSAPGQIDVANMKNVLDILHNNDKKVILVGFIGTGKTAVANALSNYYGLRKIDLNAYIEFKEEAAISDLISDDMELFLDKETKYLRRVLKKDVQVISAGTGVALREENVEMMRRSGFIVLLKARPETIAQRLKDDPGRHTINEVIDLESMDKLMRSTSGVYEDIANLTIDTDEKNIEQISKEIVERLGFTM